MSSGENWEPISGETPIDPSDLRNRGAIRSRAELAVAEAENIRQAVVKYLSARPNSRTAPFDYSWFLRLHREMFGEVWKWGGVIRTRDLNIGDRHYQLRDRLFALVGDLEYWVAAGTEVALQAVMLHHRAVAIHPFPDGNGRWARLLANIWLRRHDCPAVEWPAEQIGTMSPVRDEYIAAVKAADGGDLGPLTELHTRHSA